MPKKDLRTQATTDGGKLSTSGRLNVTYVDPKRHSVSAVVLGAGSASGLKLAVGHDRKVIDNVPAMTSRTSVSCYIAR